MVRKVATVALVLASLHATGASAAVRSCGPIVSSEIAAAPTEAAAKAEALKQWRNVAAKRGPGYESWRLAARRSVKCFPKAGGFECVALGAPCIVDQTPKSPAKKAGDKGVPI